MQKFITLLLAGASFAAIASSASAQAGPASAAAPADDATLSEIVVTARRKSESLQEVPQTVSAVTADTLQKLNIQQFRDIQSVVPGLSLDTNTNVVLSSASLRGVTFDVVTGGQPTVALYQNDAPVQAAFMFQTMFDVGQIEVLRGPQGTTRGISAPSGAITITTRKPDLEQFGGYVDVTATDQHGRNVNAAINVPIIKDVLALRVAGVIDENEAGGVRSVFVPLRPKSRTNAVRTSLSFEPSDLFNANVAYTHLDLDNQIFTQVSGPGAPPLTPALSPFDRASPAGVLPHIAQHLDLVTTQIDSRIFGQHLSYVGSYQHQKEAGTVDRDSGDPGSILLGIPHLERDSLHQTQTTQEIRLASDPAPDRFFDYTVGAYYNWQEAGGGSSSTASYLPGAFGSPAAAPSLAAFNSQYVIPVNIGIPSTNQETSLFGSLTLHLGDKTELSGGIRHLISITSNETSIVTGGGLIALPAAALGLPSCAVGHFGSTYPGFCDLPVPGGQVVQDLRTRSSERPNIYNISLSHHFSRDFMVYVNTGTSYRPPTASVGLFNGNNDPTLNALTFHPSERSRAYEVGFKSTFLNDRARLNFALYQQKFHNLTILVPGVPYISNSGSGSQLQEFNFTASVDALVQGFDIDGAFQITHDWNISGQLSYADGRVQSGSKVPCNDSNFDGVADSGAVTSISQFPAGVSVALCPGGSISRQPYWNASIQSEYTHPVTDSVDGFIRGLLSYYPQNKNRVEPNFTVPNYSLVNLYAGLRSHDGAWEASIFARNAFQTKEVTDLGQQQLNNTNTALSFFPTLAHASGYYFTTVTPRREVGVNVRYAFGSR
jgi:iron complex outermembrane receptor protein